MRPGTVVILALSISFAALAASDNPCSILSRQCREEAHITCGVTAAQGFMDCRSDMAWIADLLCRGGMNANPFDTAPTTITYPVCLRVSPCLPPLLCTGPNSTIEDPCYPDRPWCPPCLFPDVQTYRTEVSPACVAAWLVGVPGSSLNSSTAKAIADSWSLLAGANLDAWAASVNLGAAGGQTVTLTTTSGGTVTYSGRGGLLQLCADALIQEALACVRLACSTVCTGPPVPARVGAL